jgi:hypothetical protein
LLAIVRSYMLGVRWLLQSMYNRALFSKRQIQNMEAEQLNALSNKLQDLGLRSAELRRYL